MDGTAVGDRTQLRYVSPDDFQFRQKVMLLVAVLSQQNCMGMFLYEPLEMAKDSSVALAVDGIFRLRKETRALERLEELLAR